MRKIKASPNYAAQHLRAVIVEKAINISMLIFKLLPIKANKAGGSLNRIACKTDFLLSRHI